MKNFLFLLLIASILPQDVKLGKVNLNDEISVKLPKDFTPMTLEDQQQRVYSHRKSIALYTSLDRYVEFGANISYSKFRSEDIQLMKEFYKSNIANLYSDVEFYTDDVVTINGREFAVFSFSSLVTDIDSSSGGSLTPISRYTYIAYTVADGNTYLFHITAPIRQRQKWEPLAAEIMQTIKIKG